MRSVTEENAKAAGVEPFPNDVTPAAESTKQDVDFSGTLVNEE